MQWSATVAEWLRRLTRNQIPYGSAGSNPAGCDIWFFVTVNIAILSSYSSLFFVAVSSDSGTNVVMCLKPYLLVTFNGICIGKSLYFQKTYFWYLLNYLHRRMEVQYHEVARVKKYLVYVKK